MKYFPLTLMLLIFTLSLGGQTKCREIDLRINGLGVNSTYAQVRQQLGKPLEEKREKYSDQRSCRGEAELYVTLFYAGLKILCIGDSDGKNLYVTAIDVTTPNWTISSGIRLGMTRQAIENKWGKSKGSEKNAIYYCTKENLGTVKLTFAQNVLTKISVAETLC